MSQILIGSAGKEITQTARSTPADPAGNGKAICSGVKLGVMAPLAGDDQPIAQAVLGGVQVAIAAHNKANANCQVALVKVDSSSNPANAATTLGADKSVVGAVGPVTTADALAGAAQLSKVNMPLLSPSATTSSLTTRGWTTFFRGVASDDLQAESLGAYLVNVRNLLKVCVVADASVYGQDLSRKFRSALAGSVDTACSSTVTRSESELSTLSRTVKGEAPDGVLFAGNYKQAAGLIKQLRTDGVTAPLFGVDGMDSSQYVSFAGLAAIGSVIACTCVSPTASFARQYVGINHAPVGPFATEAYDLATILLKGIDSGHTDRQRLVDYVKSYAGIGLAQSYSWDSKGNLKKPAGIWISQVQ